MAQLSKSTKREVRRGLTAQFATRTDRVKIHDEARRHFMLESEGLASASYGTSAVAFRMQAACEGSGRAGADVRAQVHEGSAPTESADVQSCDAQDVTLDDIMMVEAMRRSLLDSKAAADFSSVLGSPGAYEKTCQWRPRRPFTPDKLEG